MVLGLRTRDQSNKGLESIGGDLGFLVTVDPFQYWSGDDCSNTGTHQILNFLKTRQVVLVSELDLFLYVQTLWRIGLESMLPVFFNFASDMRCIRAFWVGINEIHNVYF